MAKEIEGYIKLQIRGGQANPAPPVGPALGAKGVNIMDFCKAFNTASEKQPGKVLPVVITVFSDKSFSFVIKTPPAAILLLEAAKKKKGSPEPNRLKTGSVSWDQVRAIAEEKMADLNAFKVDSAMKMVAGTARSMGFTISGPPPWAGANDKADEAATALAKDIAKEEAKQEASGSKEEEEVAVEVQDSAEAADSSSEETSNDSGDDSSGGDEAQKDSNV